MLAAGLGNKEIANRLSISEHTAKFHVGSIMGKLGAASRTEAVALGIRRGLVLLLGNRPWPLRWALEADGKREGSLACQSRTPRRRCPGPGRALAFLF